MASKKLTKTIRNDIAEIVVNKTFGDRIEAQGKHKIELFHKVVDSNLPDDFNEILKNRENWFSYVTEITVVERATNKCLYTFSGATRKTPAYFHTSYSHQMFVTIDSLSKELQSEIMDFIKEENSIAEEKKDLIKKVNEITHSATTFKQLKELWPEVEQYYKLDDNLIFPIATVSPATLNNMIEKYKIVK